jgi:hypothetical protein
MLLRSLKSQGPRKDRAALAGIAALRLVAVVEHDPNTVGMVGDVPPKRISSPITPSRGRRLGARRSRAGAFAVAVAVTGSAPFPLQ